MGQSLHQSGDIITDAQKQLSYRILDILGEGNSGITYTAVDINNNQQTVAIKVLSFQQVQDWKMMELFEREAKVLSILKHPGIPRYLNYFHTDTEYDRKFYIVQELAPGKTLAAWVKDGFRWNEAGICQFAEQILRILIYLQKITPPVIHRDIKPENIIRDENNGLRLVDFGAVRDTYYSTLMRGSTVVGTYGYMAPEQFRGQAVPATDLYGLGATILYLLTHRSPAEIPLNGLSLDFRDREATPLEYRIQVSFGFANWLETMLAPDANERFPSAQAALDALHQSQKVKIKQPYKPSKIDGIVAILLVVVVGLWVGNANKWRVFSAMGIKPRGICNNSAVLENYLRHGGNPNARYKGVSRSWNGEYKYNYLLTCASGEGTKLLLKYGANPKLDESILEYAVLNGDVEKTKLLLESGVIPNGQIIHTPIFYSDREMVELLVKHVTDINIINSDYWGRLPLDLAIARNELEIAKILVRHGAIANKYQDSKRYIKVMQEIANENKNKNSK